MLSTSERRTVDGHVVIHCDRIGDTLIVEPQADIPEFDQNTFQTELKRVRQFAADEATRNIICDFSKKSYFSQAMVVPVLGLRDQIRTRGRLVVAGMSGEMTKLFEHSESGTHLMSYPDRNTAIREVADVSFKEAMSSRFKRSRIGQAAIALILLAGLVASWSLFIVPTVKGTPAEQLYHSLEVVWADADRVMQSNPTKANWNGLNTRTGDRLLPMTDLVRSQDEQTPADAAVLAAASQLMTIAADGRDRIEALQGDFLDKLIAAEIAIEQRDDVQLETPRAITIPFGMSN